MDENKVTYFAETDSRGKKIKFGIKQKDRTRHVYVIGKTGMGKSTMLENMAVQDILDGHGMCFIDPHGKTAELLLEYIPEHRKNDVLYFAPFDLDHPVSFNVLEKVDADKRHLVVSGLMSTFKKIWEDAWSARMEYILSNTLLALLEYPDATLLGVNRMLADKSYRQKVVDNVTDPSVKAFWVDEFAKYTDRFAAEATPAIQNKIGQFTSNALIRNMIGQPKSSFNIREMMDERKIIIVNLSKGRVGEQNANLLGGMLITKIYLAAMSRADVPDRILKTLPNFYLFVDEFQSFANKSFADILSEARKYKLNLTIAHQYIEQMEEEVRAAVFGNVGTMTIFRVGAFDAEIFEKEYAPVFTAEDIVNLGFAQIYLKLMIDGISSQPFSATTLPPIAPPAKSNREEVIEASRKQFSRTRKEVEDEINKWHEPISSGPKGGNGTGGGGASGGNGGFKDQNGGGQRSTSSNGNGSFKNTERNFDNREGDKSRANGGTVNSVPKVSVAEVKQPFREVLAGIMINDNKKPEEHSESDSGKTEKPAPISLSALAPKAHGVHHSTAHLPPEVKKIADKEKVILGQKIPTKENISDLKKALEKINSLKKEGAVNDVKKEPVPEVKIKAGDDAGGVKSEGKIESKGQSANSKEIPEEVLRNMLKVDEE